MQDEIGPAEVAPQAVGPSETGTKMVDRHFLLYGNGEVYEDYSCTLNQTNIANNINKFYIMQVIKRNNEYFLWKRSGRVGRVGQTKIERFTEAIFAVHAFKEMFKEVTECEWKDRLGLVPRDRKYTLIQVEHVQEPMDTDKMPLGKLTQAQIKKGSKMLKEIEEAINQRSGSDHLKKLSSKFFTEIPHNFGKKTPPTIDSTEFVTEKKAMLREWIQEADDEETADHPLDQLYRSLNCNLTQLDPNRERFRIIRTYYENTSDNSRNQNIVNVWQIDHTTEVERFRKKDHLKNRRLLWYYLAEEEVEHILKNGLSYSDGPFDKGVYFASQSGISRVYETSKKNTGVMFLCEVALGKELIITSDDISLTEARKGSHSMVAQGRVEPDPSDDISIDLDGKKVTVPQGQPEELDRFADSSFENTLYVIYKKSQCRLRYLVELHSPEDLGRNITHTS